jgi:hypothetical protein
MIRRDDYYGFKALAAHHKITQVDFMHKLLMIYADCIKAGHEQIIEDLRMKLKIALNDLMLYLKRIGKIQRWPEEKEVEISEIDTSDIFTR